MKKAIATLAMILLTPATIAAAVPVYYAIDEEKSAVEAVDASVNTIIWEDMVAGLYTASATPETIELLTELEAAGVPERHAASFNRIAIILRDKYMASLLNISY